MTGEDGEGSDHDERDDLGEVGVGKEHKKENQYTRKDESGLDFVEHGGGKEEKVAEEEKGRGEGACF